MKADAKFKNYKRDREQKPEAVERLRSVIYVYAVRMLMRTKQSCILFIRLDVA